MEIIVIDLAARPTPPLATRPDVCTNYIVPEKNISWAQGRAQAVRLANTPIVAFIEDHCCADPGWAEALVRAHQGPWVCVGYAFTNPNPKSYLARATIMAEYGMWLHPATSGPASVLPSHNISYKREPLISLGNELEILLTPDFGAYQQFTRRGLKMYLESAALVGHFSDKYVRDQIAASFAFSRLLGARRAQTQKWSLRKRIFYSGLTPFAAPAFALWRLVASLRNKHSLWGTLVIALPIIFLRFPVSGLGEATGYLFGEGSSDEGVRIAELSVERDRAG